MDNLPYGNATFDIAYARHTLHYTENLKRTLAEIERVLKPNGTLYVIDSHPINALFLKPSHDYAQKEMVVFPTQWNSSIRVQHPNFTFAEYLTAIKETGLELLSCSEGYGRDAEMFPPYRIPTNLCFKLRKL
jgi:ubiquinone/menaquinone biosynthesis C-methylase UbiE